MPERGGSEGEAQGPDLARGRDRRGDGGDRAPHAARARAARARLRPDRRTPAWCSRRRAGTTRIMELAEEMLGLGRRSASDAGRPRAGRARARARARARRRHGRAVRRGAARLRRLARRRAGRAPQGGRERGACVRVVQGDSTYFGHVDGLAEEDLLRVAGSVAQAVRGDARHRPRCAAAESGDAPPGRDAARGGRGAPQGRRCCARATSAPARPARRSPRRGRLRRDRSARWRSSAPTACAAADDRTRVRLGAQVVARRDGRVETGTETRGGHAGWELLEERPGGGGRRGSAAGADAARRGRRARPGRCRWSWATASAACCCTRRSGTGSRPTRSRSTRASTRAGSASSWRRAVRDRLRRRQPPERVGQRRHRRRGHADAADDGDRGRRADAPTSTT